MPYADDRSDQRHASQRMVRWYATSGDSVLSLLRAQS
jgi:hypothetical protein